VGASLPCSFPDKRFHWRTAVPSLLRGSRALILLESAVTARSAFGPEGAILSDMESAATSQVYGSAASATGRVLVADDQPHVLEALQLLLKGHGYQTEAVTHPARVLQALEANEFDVVLLDLNYTRDTTAGGEGLELVSQIRARDESLPLVVMTAWSSVDLAVEAMRRGASDFVQKPWQNSQLLDKLQAQIERVRELREAGRRRQDELQEAREIQSNLLPKKLPQVSDYEVAGMTQPVRFVGGDYYNVVRISDRETVLCIADVAGKGMPAALLMSSLQAALKPLMWQKLAPRELCRRLNRILCDLTPVNKFISFFYAVLDDNANRLTYCNAGHNPPLLVHADGTATELNAAGAVLGQFPDWVYEQSEVYLNRGDQLLMFTDGLVEACDHEEEPLGEASLVRVATKDPGANATEVMNALMRAASEHCGGRFQDDASLVVLRAL
jgi:sigma-B regulation protein RsbU (phosphoserine phosphatase)